METNGLALVFEFMHTYFMAIAFAHGVQRRCARLGIESGGFAKKKHRRLEHVGSSPIARGTCIGWVCISTLDDVRGRRGENVACFVSV